MRRDLAEAGLFVLVVGLCALAVVGRIWLCEGLRCVWVAIP